MLGEEMLMVCVEKVKENCGRSTFVAVIVSDVGGGGGGGGSEHFRQRSSQRHQRTPPHF